MINNIATEAKNIQKHLIYFKNLGFDQDNIAYCLLKMGYTSSQLEHNNIQYDSDQVFKKLTQKQYMHINPIQINTNTQKPLFNNWKNDEMQNNNNLQNSINNDALQNTQNFAIVAQYVEYKNRMLSDFIHYFTRMNELYHEIPARKAYFFTLFFINTCKLRQIMNPLSTPVMILDGTLTEIIEDKEEMFKNYKDNKKIISTLNQLNTNLCNSDIQSKNSQLNKNLPPLINILFLLTRVHENFPEIQELYLSQLKSMKEDAKKSIETKWKTQYSSADDINRDAIEMRNLLPKKFFKQQKSIMRFAMANNILNVVMPVVFAVSYYFGYKYEMEDVTVTTSLLFMAYFFIALFSFPCSNTFNPCILIGLLATIHFSCLESDNMEKVRKTPIMGFLEDINTQETFLQQYTERPLYILRNLAQDELKIYNTLLEKLIIHLGNNKQQNNQKIQEVVSFKKEIEIFYTEDVKAFLQQYSVFFSNFNLVFQGRLSSTMAKYQQDSVKTQSQFNIKGFLSALNNKEDEQVLTKMSQYDIKMQQFRKLLPHNQNNLNKEAQKQK